MPVARILGVLAFLVRWILIVIVIILLIILWIRVGVLASFRGREIYIYIRAGVFKFQVWPRRVETPDDEKKKKKKKEKKRDDAKAKKKRKKKKKSDKKEKEKKELIKPDISMILDAVKSLPGSILKMLVYTARGIKIKPLNLNIIFGGADDPAEAARLCGDTLAAVWTVMPVLERWMIIPEPDINISADFDEVDTRIQGEVGAGFRIGRLLCAAIPVIWVVIRLLIKLSGANKRNNNQDKSGTDNPADNQEDNGDGE